MSGEDLAVLVTAVALTSAQSLSINDLNILVAVFTQLADTYATISVIRALDEERCETPSEQESTAQQEESIIALETV